MDEMEQLRLQTSSSAAVPEERQKRQKYRNKERKEEKVE